MNTTTEIRTPVPGGFEQITVSSTVKTLDPLKFNPDGRPADMAIITCETDAVRYRSDGQAPTAAVGHQLAVAGVLLVYGEAAMRALQLIRVTGDATLFVSYFRQG